MPLALHGRAVPGDRRCTPAGARQETGTRRRGHPDTSAHRFPRRGAPRPWPGERRLRVHLLARGFKPRTLRKSLRDELRLCKCLHTCGEQDDRADVRSSRVASMFRQAALVVRTAVMPLRLAMQRAVQQRVLGGRTQQQHLQRKQQADGLAPRPVHEADEVILPITCQEPYFSLQTHSPHFPATTRKLTSPAFSSVFLYFVAQFATVKGKAREHPSFPKS